MKKNELGFTLVELLVTIAIMGIVLFLVIPSLLDFQSKNKGKPYEYYGKSLVEAAKIYVDKEDEDLTSLGTTDWNGCIDISYDTLLQNDLIKVYNEERYDCTSAKVRYIKNGKQNTYQYNLTCIDTKTSKMVFQHQEIAESACTQTAS